MRKKTLEDVNPRGEKVLVRADFNVPFDSSGAISDDSRIRACLPTLRYLLDRECAVILMSHLGRPKSGPDPKFSLAPVARRLAELLDRPVELAGDVAGPSASQKAAALEGGQVLMLENVRFEAGETKNDEGLSRRLAALGDLYVNDAFGSSHRAHSSTVGIAGHLPSVAGYLLQKEIEYLSRVTGEPERPFVAILGGAKVSDKVGVISHLGEKADRLLIGGAMAFTFFAAKGASVGSSLLESEKVAEAKALLERFGDKLLLPSDVVIADEPKPGQAVQVVAWDRIPAGKKGLDIGPATVEAFGSVIAEARTIVWNGPMGVFEVPEFAQGTREVARLVAGSGGISVIGGGDSAAAIAQMGFSDRVSHVSTGGGASLEFLEGKELPGVAALNDAGS